MSAWQRGRRVRRGAEQVSAQRGVQVVEADRPHRKIRQLRGKSNPLVSTLDQQCSTGCPYKHALPDGQIPGLAQLIRRMRSQKRNTMAC
jgi:hypothetical protein